MSEPTTIYTAEELAVLLKQHVKTVPRKAKAGVYPHTRLGNEYRFTQADYEAILEAGKPKIVDTRAARKELRLRLKTLNW